MKIKSLLKIIIPLFFVLLSAKAIALGPPGPPGGGGGGGGTPPCWPPPCVPIDGGIGFLLAAGALYGAKKIYQKSKKAE
ncbi:MAG: hypothetical protein HND27_04765 [Bacteroidetes bacterium]|nr:hypothetical protein [Flavobacteriales bacterium]NOG95071.1 hypothetical protein [Bacteroidota bacterium]WKZ74458.1 MAG: hypothetical protein QY303_09915 [Vicingaceae bacterium]GIK69013.1 MAG: hypothetical protein BroJett020_03080 [Bacteroidota bacterium]CAG0952963.1 hypothetical protein FLAV_00287 [Flavobacteriales bacterium]